MEGDTSGFHDDVVVDGFGALNPILDLLDRASKGQGEFLIITLKPPVA